MSLPKEAIEELKQIHLKETGEMLSDQVALEMGTRLLGLFRIIMRPIPEDTAESDKQT